MSDDEIDQLISELLTDESDVDEGRYDRDRLLQIIDKNCELRDECFYTPETILVYTEEMESLEAVPIWELPLRFPLQGRGARWGYSSFGEIVERKSVLWRQSKAADSLAEDYPDARPVCGTVCLVVPRREGVMSWVEVKAHIAPELNR
jgi:hypothetical protein